MIDRMKIQKIMTNQTLRIYLLIRINNNQNHYNNQNKSNHLD